jgi:hypothetical protein
MPRSRRRDVVELELLPLAWTFQEEWRSVWKMVKSYLLATRGVWRVSLRAKAKDVRTRLANLRRKSNGT